MDLSQMETRKSPRTRSQASSITRNKEASITRSWAASEEPISDDDFVTPKPTTKMLKKACMRHSNQLVQPQKKKKKHIQYDWVMRKVDVVIDPELGTQYKAQTLCYIIFHKLNANGKEFPEEIL